MLGAAATWRTTTGGGTPAPAVPARGSGCKRQAIVDLVSSDDRMGTRRQLGQHGKLVGEQPNSPGSHPLGQSGGFRLAVRQEPGQRLWDPGERGPELAVACKHVSACMPRPGTRPAACSYSARSLAGDSCYGKWRVLSNALPDRVERHADGKMGGECAKRTPPPVSPFAAWIGMSHWLPGCFSTPSSVKWTTYSWGYSGQ